MFEHLAGRRFRVGDSCGLEPAQPSRDQPTLRKRLVDAAGHESAGRAHRLRPWSQLGGLERIFVRRGPVHRRNRHVQQAEIDHELAAVVIPVIEKHDRRTPTRGAENNAAFPLFSVHVAIARVPDSYAR
jgi:hypothetical protein